MFLSGEECSNIPFMADSKVTLTTETGIEISTDYYSLSQLTIWHNSNLSISCDDGYELADGQVDTVLRCNETQMWHPDIDNCTLSGRCTYYTSKESKRITLH